MRLFLLPPDFNGSDNLRLTGKDFNYIVNVLRLKEGCSVTGRDKEGKVWNLTLETVTKKECILSAVSTSKALATTDQMPQDRPQKNIILYQCIPKGRKLDEIIRMATETGVRTVVPVRSRNCVADISGKENARIERYNAVVREAIQQSGSLVPTCIDAVLDISEIPSDFEKKCRNLGTEGRGLFFHQCRFEENQQSLLSVLKEFSGTVGILVGSEGGLTDEECAALIKGGFIPVLLKTNILRCETASVYAISAVQTIIEEEL
ncbi:MAG: 16S rRNA (uracil(1498)-N(3))-methyltransferase [Sphaerochaetaceae bacterium]|nr:16S rRNA (uracil(1498)-N(3))-methyltransferase [Sphaerochaetaceae bacterium]